MYAHFENADEIQKRRDEAAESCTIDGESPVVKNFQTLENPE